MEYVPRELREYFEYDQENNWELWLEINGEILEKYCCRTSLCHFNNYAKLLYALEWPGDFDKEDFANATYNQDGFMPILLRGVVIDRVKREDGTYVLQLVDVEKRTKYDAETLLHLRNCASVIYSLIVSALYKDREYTIGALEDIRPGTRVIVAVANLGISPNNPKWWVTGQYVDIDIDKDAEYAHLDRNYRIQQSTVEFLTLYKKIATERKNKAQPQTNSNEGCYIATSVYGSYDCPEVWTLRRFRDNTLAATWYGQAFIQLYYAVSPTMVKWLGHKRWFQRSWRRRLDAMVERLQRHGVDSSPYCDKKW